jgi:hypothetical protein
LTADDAGSCVVCDGALQKLCFDNAVRKTYGFTQLSGIHNSTSPGGFAEGQTSARVCGGASRDERCHHRTIIERTADGWRHLIDGVNAQGQKTHTETRYKDDGSEAQVVGAAAPTTRTLKRINDRTYEDMRG